MELESRGHQAAPNQKMGAGFALCPAKLTASIQFIDKFTVKLHVLSSYDNMTT
jgi:hypothetical protein